jgi:cytochrome c oxidase subunit 3
MSIVKNIINSLDSKNGKQKRSPILMALLVSISVLFIPFVVLLLNAKTSGQFTVPNNLSVSTLTLITSSWLIFKAKDFKSNDHYKQFLWSLSAILVLGITFLCFQYFGWKVILDSLKNQQRSIIAVIITVHAFHFILAIGCVAAIVIQSYRIESSADFFIHFLKANRNSFLYNTFLYWEFLTFLWVGLYLLMLLI